MDWSSLKPGRRTAGLTLLGCLLLGGVAAEDDADGLLALGVALAQKENYSEAIVKFEQYIAKRPESFEGRYDLALALLALGRFPEARNAMETASPHDATQRGAKAYVFGRVDQELGRTDEALRELSEAYQSSKGEENYALDLGVLLIRQGKYPEAMNLFEHALELHPRSGYVRLGLAMAQAFGGKPHEAAGTCRDLLQREPNFGAANLLLAFSHYLAGEYEQAERAAAKGMESPSASPYLAYVDAAALVKLNSKETDRILRELDAAERGIPKCSLCWLVRSKAHQDAGNSEAAIADLEMVVNAIAPDLPTAWYRLAGLYRKAGREADAEAALRKFQKIKTTDADADADLLRRALLPPGSR